MDYVNHDLGYAFINPDSKTNIPFEFMLNVEFKKNVFLDENIPLRLYMFQYFVGFVKALLDTKHGLSIEDVLWKRIVRTVHNPRGEEVGQKVFGLKVSFRKGKIVYMNILKFGDQHQQPIGLTKDDFLELNYFYSKKEASVKGMQIFLTEYNIRRADPWLKAGRGNNPCEIYVEKIYNSRLETFFHTAIGHKSDAFKVVKKAEHVPSSSKIRDIFSRMKSASNRPFVFKNELMNLLSREYDALVSSKFLKPRKGGLQAFMHGSLAHLKTSHDIDVVVYNTETSQQSELRQTFDNEHLLLGMDEPIFFSVEFFDSITELAADNSALLHNAIRPLKPPNGPINSGYKALISSNADDISTKTIVSDKPVSVERPKNMINCVESILESKDLLGDPSLLKQSEKLLYNEIQKVMPKNQKFSIAEWKHLSRYIAGMLTNTKNQKFDIFRLQRSTDTFPGSINFLIKNKETDLNLIFSIAEQYISRNEVDRIDSQVKVENFLNKQSNDLLDKNTVIFHFFVHPKHIIDDYQSFDRDSTDFLNVDVLAQTTSINELSTMMDMKKVMTFDMRAMLTDHQVDKQTLSKMFDVMFTQNSDLIDSKENFGAFIDGLFHNMHDSVKNLYKMPNAYSRRQVTLLGESPVTTINFALDLLFEESGQACEHGHKMLVESKPVDEFKGHTFVSVVYDRKSNKETKGAVALLRTKVMPRQKAVSDTAVKKINPRQSMLALLWKIYQLIWKYAWNICKHRIRLFKRSEMSMGNSQCVYKSINDIEDRKQSIFEAHASKLNSMGNYVMNGLLIRDIVADLIHWDTDGLKNDAIFLGASAVSSYAAQGLEKLGASALANGQKVFGSLTKVASTAVGKSVLLYYVIKDLMDNWHLVQNKTLAKVNVGSDAAILTMEGIDLTATALEGLGFIAGASAVTGPVAGVTAAVLLLGTNVYQAVDKVSQIDKQIKLCPSERIVEGLLAFAHLNSEDKISRLLDEKIQIEATFSMAVDFLQRHAFIKNYVAQVGGENNFIDLRAKVPVLGSRVSLDKQANIFCQSHEADESTHEGIWQKIKSKIFSIKQQEVSDYNCTNSLGVSSTVDETKGDVTFYQLGTGDDTVFGFQNSLNIFNVSSGNKEIRGGKMDDIFLLNGWSIFGSIYADEGYNSVDINSLLKGGVVNIAGYADVLYIYYDKDTIPNLEVKNMHSVTGRVNATDMLHLSCNLRMVNLQGGKSSKFRDCIFINDESCTFETRVMLTGHSKVLHGASNGKFTYMILSHSNTEMIFQKGATPSQLFVFDQPFTDMQKFSLSADELQFHLTNETVIFLQIAKSMNQVQFTFADNVSMSIDSAGYPIAHLKTADPTELILDKYSELTKNLHITLVVKTINGHILTLNHGQYAMGDENSHEKFTIMHNDPDHTMHMGEGVGNHVLILSANNGTLKNVFIDMNDNNIDANLTIDFTSILATMPLKKRLELDVSCKDTKNCSDFRIAVNVLGDSDISRCMGSISILNANLSRISILKNLPLTFDSVKSDEYPSLIPMPLHYPKSTSLIIVTQQMIERHTRLIVAKNVRLLSPYRVNDTLILTNVENSMIFNEKQVLMIVLMDYFKYSSIFDSISFIFEEQSIYLNEMNLDEFNVPLEDLIRKIDKNSDFYQSQIAGDLSVKSFERMIKEKLV